MEIQNIQNDVQKAATLIKLISDCEDAINKADMHPSPNWETVFERIFRKFGRNIGPLFKDLDIEFDYYDPDTTYEDDVKALVRALSEHKEQLQADFPALECIASPVQDDTQKTAILIKLIDDCEAILAKSDTLGWEAVFVRVFRQFDRYIKPLFNDLGIGFDYYDPDTTYEDDVKALVKALSEFSRALTRVTQQRRS